MKRIFKYCLETTDEQTIGVPELTGYSFKDQVLKVDTQREKPCLWILVDDSEQTVKRHIAVVGTGHYCGEELEDYLGSYQIFNGQFVGHVFGY